MHLSCCQQLKWRKGKNYVGKFLGDTKSRATITTDRVTDCGKAEITRSRNDFQVKFQSRGGGDFRLGNEHDNERLHLLTVQCRKPRYRELFALNLTMLHHADET